MFSFLLEPGFQDMYIEDVPCITLAHGIEDDEVATHPFYGTEKVIEAMQKHDGFADGLVEVLGVKRDINFACGFEF